MVIDSHRVPRRRQQLNSTNGSTVEPGIMPRKYGVDVSIVRDVEDGGAAFAEYGTKDDKGTRTVETKIEATNNKLFCIRVRPKCPYVISDRRRPQSIQVDCADSRLHLAESAATQHQSSQQFAAFKEEAAEPPLDTVEATVPMKKELAKLNKNAHDPGFDFLVKVYIDGRPVAEQRLTVYLKHGNEKHDAHCQEGYLMRGRWIEGGKDQDRLVLLRWKFEAIGVMFLEEGLNTICLEEDLAEDMRVNLSLERPKAGQIVVELHRITIDKDKTKEQIPYKPLHSAGQQEKVNIKDLGQATHTTTFAPGEDVKADRVRSVFHDAYKEGEGVFARFVFEYMDMSKLAGRQSTSGLAIEAPLGSYDVYNPNKREAEGPETRSKTRFKRQNEGDDGAPAGLEEQGWEEVG